MAVSRKSLAVCRGFVQRSTCELGLVGVCEKVASKGTGASWSMLCFLVRFDPRNLSLFGLVVV